MNKSITKDSTRDRLNEIDKELKDLGSKKAALMERWKQEKKYIKSIREYKAEIEKNRSSADDFERKGDLGKVAEIRYGTLPDLERKLNDVNDKLYKVQSSGKLLKEEIDSEDVAEVVSKWTGIPVTKMLEAERDKIVNMEDRIHKRLIGQNDAVTAVSNAIRRSRSGLQDKNKPVGSFIFVGTTGVGKTEMAKSLAEFLFDDESSIVRIDMSEYMEKYSVSRLIGAPPGYVGYEEGGQLTEAVRQKPYSVILLDEIEKAHIEVFNVLLQVLDEGRLTDGKGRTVNFRNCIIIMTSNLGTELIQDRLLEITDENRAEIMSEMRMNISDMLRKKLRPEFLNRIDDIILFQPLTRKEINEIAMLQVEKFKTKLTDNGLELGITPDAIEWLTKIGFEPQYGARPLKRAIQKHLADPLALKLLAEEFSQGDTIVVDCDDSGCFVFKKKTD